MFLSWFPKRLFTNAKILRVDIRAFWLGKLSCSKLNYDKLNWYVVYWTGPIWGTCTFHRSLSTWLWIASRSSAGYQVIVNGELSDSFTRGRAIRQGDTLCLPIFLCYSWKNYHNGIPFLPLIMVSVSLSLLENMSIVTTTRVSHLFFCWWFVFVLWSQCSAS